MITEPEIINGIPIVQAHTGTDSIGRFDLVVDRGRNCLDSYTWELIKINDKTAPRNPQIERIVSKYKEVTDAKYSRVLTRFSRELTHPGRNMETELGNLFADIFKESLGVDVMILGSGSIRSDYMGPIVTYGDLVTGFPYDDEIYMLEVTGAQLRKMIKYMQRDEAFTGHTEYYQFSKGVEIIYSKSKHDFEKFEYMGEELKDDRLYSIGLQTFHYNNFELAFGFNSDEVAANRKPRVIATSCFQIVEEYMSAHRKMSAKVEGRNKVID